MSISITRKKVNFKPSEAKQQRPCQKDGCSGTVSISMADIAEKREVVCNTCGTVFSLTIKE